MPPLTDADKRALHSCMKNMSSLTCSACNAGIPYPHPSLADIEADVRGNRPPVDKEHERWLKTWGVK